MPHVRLVPGTRSFPPSALFNTPAVAAPLPARRRLHFRQAFVISGYSLFFAFFGIEGRRLFAAAHTEIELASTIHRALVPPLTLSIPGVELYGVPLPSGAEGGDLHDVLHHPEAALRGYARAPLVILADRTLDRSRAFGPITDGRTLVLIRMA